MCPNINIEQVRNQFNEIVTALGGNPLTVEEFKDKELRHQRTGVDAAAMDAAYDIWDQNQGNPIDKAPNGQESILFKSLEEHYGDRQKAIVAKANVYSKAFKNWFGDWTSTDKADVSKVIDQNGEPLVVYHGTPNGGFNVFEKRSTKRYTGDGFYFTANKEYAEIYHREGRSKEKGDNPETYAVFLNIKNPIQDGTPLGNDDVFIYEQDIVHVSKKLMTSNGHDGIFDKNHLTEMVVPNPNQIKSIDNDGILRDNTDNIHYLSEQDPTKIKRREAFTIEEVAFSNALATNLKALFPELSVDYVEAIDGNYVGEIDLKALRVLIHSTKSTMDTLPHEYAHYYIAMFRGSDLVNEGIAEFGSEEALVQAIGEQTVAQKGKARNLWKRFTDWIKNKLNKNKYGQQVLLAQLTDAFLTRKTLGQIQAELDGVEHQTANPSITEVKDRLSSISALVEFNEPSHGFTDRQTGKSLRAVSDWKKLYGYETYDDTNEDSLQHRVSDEARQYGDYIHAAMQALFEQRFDPAAFSNMSEEAINSLTWIVNRIKEDYDFVAAEAILADPEKNVAGITDLILRDKHTGEYVLMDYKTKLINYNGGNKNIRGKQLWGFKYVDSTTYSQRTSRHSYDFQLSMYQQILKKYGINISKRFIVPISYKRQDDQITGCFVGHKFGDKTLPDKAAYAEIVPNPAVRFDVVTKIFGDVSNTKLSKEFLQQQVENFVEISSKFRKQLEASVKLFERSNKTKSQARDIRETLSHLADAQEVDFFMAYLTLVQNQLAKFVTQLNKRYEDYDNALWDLDVLQRYKEVSSAYEDMDSIIAFMYQFQNAFTKEQIALVEGACNQVMSLKNQIDGAYKQKGAEIYINQIMKYVGNVRQQFEDEVRKAFIENNPNATEQQIKQHVEQKVSDNKEKIEFKTKEWIRRQMSVADSVFECSQLSAYLNSVYASRDPLVQATVAMFEEKMQPVDRAYNRYVQQMSALLKEYVAKYGGGTFANQRDLYDDMIEVHDGLCYLVQEIPLSYTLAKQAFEKQLREDTSLNRQKREAKLFEWLETNAPVHDLGAYQTELTNRVEEIVQGLSAEEKKAVYDNLKKPMKDRSTWYYLYKTNKISSETEAALMELFIDLEKFRKPSPIYKNDKYQKLLALKSSNDVKWRMYEFLSETAKDADSKVDLHKKRLDGRLPAVRKTSLDRTLEGQGAKSVTVNWAKENSCLVEDDAFQGEYIDVNGRKIKQIPLYYNSKELTEQDQRFDLPTIYGMWYKSALEYDAKRQVRAFMEYTEFVLNTRMTKTNTISWLDKVRGNNQGQEVLAKADNTAKQFSGFMDQVFYNNTLQDLGQTGIVNNSKVFQKILSYYSSLVMSFNGVSGINNFLNAEIQGLEEAFGGELFGIKNYTKATKEYWKHMKGMLTDLSSGRAPKDKVSLLVKHFGLFDRNTISLRASGMMRHSLSDIAHWPNTIGEHHSQVRLLLAALMQREALDENGKSLGSLYDYLSFDADGNLIVADGVANFSEADQIEFATAIRTTIMETAGNYDSRMKALANQQAWGRLVLTLRKWVYPSIHRRFAEEYYDNLRGQKVKGFYRSGFKTIRDVAIAPILQYVGLADKLKLKATKWNELSELDKRNVKRFATEMGVLALSSAIFYMLSGVSGDGDDEWDVFLKNVQYQAYRLSNDLSFYFNPESFARILQDPFPTMTLLTDITRLFWQLFDPLEEYTSGARKGESKLWYYSSRLLPGIKQMDRFGNIAEEMELFQNVF